jgi:amino acid adenylation domain-containing protein
MEISSEREVFGYPLSFAQRRLWFLDQLFPGIPLYNLPLVIHLGRPVDAGVLERCLSEIAMRHEALRTTFRTVSGEPVQVVAADTNVPLRVVVLEHLAEAERESAAMALAAEDLRRPFDLATGPLWRATLVSLGHADHLLLITAHHIVSDGWSMGLMLQELDALYAAFAAGKPSPLTGLPLQYVDYALWQRETLSSEALSGHLAYWRETLADLPAIDLPSDRSRPAVSTLRGRRSYFAVPAGVRRAVDALAQREGATPFMTMLAAFALLLHRSTGDTDIPIGTPIAGRTRPELEPLIGFFVNTLVIRTDLDGDPTFRELLRRVRECALEAYTHQDLPFEKLVEELQPVRDLSRNPLFQVMFALQNAPTAGADREGRALRSVELETGLTGFDLALDVWSKGAEYAARIEFSLDLFDEPTVHSLAARWVALLGDVVADPDRHVSEYALGGIDEGAPPTVTAAGARDTAHERTVLDDIEESLRSNGNADAVIADGVRLTFADLDARSRALAGVLRSYGVGPEQPVAVLLDRSPDVVVALLAIWRAGGAYVPLDSRDPALRLQQVLADVQPRVLLTTRGKVEAKNVQAVFVDEVPPLAEARFEPGGVRPRDLAYIMYTSGSTGVPRGVAVEHRSVANHLAWMQSAFPLRAGDRVLQTTSLGFDVSVWELVAPLAAGATLVLPPLDAEAEPSRVAALLERYGIAMLQTTPSFLRLLLDEDLAGCRSLRWIFCGAEPLPRALAERFLHSGSTAVLHNVYGPTEGTIDAAFYTCSSAAALADTRGGTVPIGKPIDNVQLSVLDSAGRRVPQGVAGELYISGANLARGYWRQPGLTAERFVPDPFGGGSLMYRTCDRARMLRTGDVELLGRVDRQVKVRGVRVEPGEIENALAMHPHVIEAFVAPAASARGDRHLVAYVAVDGSQPGAPDLRRFLEGRLSAAMMPGAFVVVDALPRTARGKVDVRRLSGTEVTRQQSGQVHVPPRTPAETALVEIWQGLLAVPRIGVHDNFFELGGHSLLATQVMSRVLGRFGAAVSLRAFFEQPTVAALAAFLESAPPQRSAGPEYEPVEPEAWALTPDRVDGLTDHEVTQLLQAMLGREAAG